MTKTQELPAGLCAGQSIRPICVSGRTAVVTGVAFTAPFVLMVWLWPETWPAAVVPVLLCVVIWSSTLPRPSITPGRYSLALQDRNGRIRRVEYKDIWVAAPQKGVDGHVLHFTSGWPRALWVPDTPQVRSMVRRIKVCNATGHGDAYLEGYQDVPDSALSLSAEDPSLAVQPRALSPADPPDQRTESEDA